MMRPIKSKRMPIVAFMLLWCTMLTMMEAAPVTPLADLNTGTPVATNIRDAVPSDFPNLLFHQSFTEDMKLDGWTGTYSPSYDYYDGKFNGFNVENLTTPELDLSGATHPVIMTEDSSFESNLYISTDGKYFVKIIWRYKNGTWYRELPLNTKYIRIQNSCSKNSNVTILDLSNSVPGYSTDFESSYITVKYADGMIYDMWSSVPAPYDIKRYMSMTSEAFHYGGARVYDYHRHDDCHFIAHTENEYIRLSPLPMASGSTYFIPEGTTELFVYAGDGSSSPSDSFWMKDDFSQFNSTQPATSPSIPVAEASWYDINGDGIMDFVSDGVYVSNNTGYSAFVPEDWSYSSGKYGNLMNVGGENGILWYDAHIRGIDANAWAAPIIHGETTDEKYIYYPADINNDGRLDLMKLGAVDGVTDPKKFFSVTTSGNGIIGNLNNIPLDEYLKNPISVGEGNIQSALASMSGMGIWSPPVYEKSTGETFESHDINSDGLPDIIDFVHSKIYYNIGKEQFAMADFGGQMIVRDLNGDGIEDFIIHDHAVRTTTSYIQLPEGGIKEKQLLSGFYCGKEIYAADVNSDGHVDLVLPINNSNNGECTLILIMENKGDGTFKKHENPLPASYTVHDLRDIDNDGKYELLMTAAKEVLTYSIINCKLTSEPEILVNVSRTTEPIILPDINTQGQNAIYNSYTFDSGVKLLTLEPVSNTLPTAPDCPSFFYEPSTGMLKVNWQPASDKETPVADLTYSLRVGTAPGLDDVVCADALPDGRRRNLTGGNMGYSLHRKFDASSWPDGTLYISVQAVDGANGGSPFSEYAVFEKREPANGFVISKETPVAIGDKCTVSLISAPKEGYNYQWDFSGGRIISSDEATQTYEIAFDTPGEKTVSLTVSTGDYTAPTVSKVIDIHGGVIKPGKLQSEKGYEIYANWAADIDEDGQNEVFYSTSKKFMESLSPGVYKDIQRLFNSHSSVSELYAAKCVDINGDGHADFFGKNGVGAINQEDKDMEIVTDLFDGDGDYYDLNNNGLLDYITNNRYYLLICANENEAYKTFGATQEFERSFDSIYRWGDYNGDGLIDFIGINSQRFKDEDVVECSLSIHENQGNFTFKRQEPFCTVRYEYGGILDVRDFDNNGKPDVLFARYIAYDTYALFIHWDDGQETPVESIVEGGESLHVTVGPNYKRNVVSRHDFDNNGFIDIYAKIDDFLIDDYRGLLAYVVYIKPGRKFEIKRIYEESAVYADMYLGDTPFIASDRRRYLTADWSYGGTIDTPNERPQAPTALRHSQSAKAVVIEWDPSVDKETPACQMRYNISVKRKGVDGEGAYLISPCNGGKNGVAVPTNKQLLNATRFTIPVASIPAGEYEVKVQGIDLMRDASDFSEVYLMKVTESCGIEVPATGEVDYPVEINILSNASATPDWDGGEVKSSGGSRYSVVWHTAGRKCVTVGDESAYILVKEAPDASFTLPAAVCMNDRIKLDGNRLQDGNWQIRVNARYDWEPLSDKEESRFASLELVDNNTAYLTFIRTGNYEIRHSLSDGFATTEDIRETVSAVSRSPQISLVNIDPETGKHCIRWTSQEVPEASGVNLYKETSIIGNYKLVANLPLETTSFVDLESTPEAKASRYRLTYALSYGESSPCVAHQPIHVMINRGAGNSWNLIWSKYEGITIESYRILRGSSPESLAVIDEVSGNMTSYCDINPPAGALFYAVEILNTGVAGAPARNSAPRTVVSDISRSNVVAAVGDASVNPVTRIDVYSVSGKNVINFTSEKYIDLFARVAPFNATFMNTNWIIASGENLATVDNRGRVTATGRGNGDVVVRAYAIDGSGVYGDFTVQIQEVESGVETVLSPIDEKLSIYPAIADTEIEVSGLPADDNGVSQLYIFGVNGMIVHQQKVAGKSVTVNCSTFTDGVYIVKAVSNRGDVTGRFIKR